MARYRLNPLSIRETTTTALPVSSATVTVYLAGTSTLATAYADTTTGTPLTGSQTTTNSSGYFEFFIDSKDYSNTQKFKIVISKTGKPDVTYDYLNIFPDLSGVRDPWVDVRAFGAVGDGDTDDTAAITSAFAAAAANKMGARLAPNKTYLTSNLTMAGTGNVPLFVDLNGSTLKAKTGTTGVFVTIENPQTLIAMGFQFGRGIIDANGQCSTALLIHGSQHADYHDLRAINSTDIGIHIKGESGYGVYYNDFRNILSGANGASNGGDGWEVKSLGAGNYIANNAFIICKAQFNKGRGWDIDWASNTYVACEAEKNDLYGFYIDNTYSSDFIGGYSEHNHENWATGGASDGTPDISFRLTANSSGVKVIGGRHIGYLKGDGASDATSAHDGTFHASVFMNTGNSGTLGYELATKLLQGINNLKIGSASMGGIGIGGANPVDNSINFSNGAAALLQLSGTTYLALNPTGTKVIAYKPMFIENTGAALYSGSGTPEGAVTANVGSIFLRTDGGAGTSIYVKESGTGDTGWVAK